MYLLDTNILIYYLNGDAKTISFLEKLAPSEFSISVVTRLEVLVGIEKQKLKSPFAESWLDTFQNMVIDRDIIQVAVSIQKKTPSKLAFKDLIIAATAMYHGATLVTSDRDFKKIRDIRVIMLNATKS